MAAAKRATSLKELGAKMALMFDEEKQKEGLAIKLRPTDVVISPFGKSGTTWTQMIVHTLRTRGDLDFDDISRVVPWIETSPGLGIDLAAEQKANPRAFKSHLGWDDMPRGGKYIIVIRDPKDAAWSMFKFMEGWFVEPGSIPLEEFVTKSVIGQGAYWKHLMSWWPRRHDDDVLMMSFEGMKQDLAGTIQRIAKFIDIKLDPELQAITEQHASLAFMQKHGNKFDDLLMRKRSEKVAGLPPGGDSAKVRKGQVGEHKQHLSAEILSALDTVWQTEVTEKTGFSDYQTLAEALEADH
jgi:hypothetical protein